MANIIEFPLKAEYQYLCPSDEKDLIRIGIDQDGGYVIPRSLVDRSDFLLSYGLGDDWSFEQGFSDLRPDVPICVYDGGEHLDFLTQDQKISYGKFFPARAHHIKETVGNNPGQTTFLESLARTNGKNIFVKMDIEGAEYQCTSGMLNHHDRIIGMVIEFHGTSDDKPFFKNNIEELNKFYQIAHIHANNCVNIYADLPDVLEISFIRRDLANAKSKRPVSYIPSVDRPNNPNSPDYCLIFNLS